MENSFDYTKYYPAEAIAAAEKLKLELEKRLLDKTAHAWSCSCGACARGPSKVVGIEMPTTYEDQLAQFNLWTCAMMDDTDRKWSQGLTTYITWAELYPMFRNAFDGIPVSLEHPFSLLLAGCAEYSGSGVLATVREGEPVDVRLRGDTTNSAWVTAQIRIDSRLEDYRGYTMACDINPQLKHYGNRLGRKGRNRFDVNKHDGATFAASIFGEGPGIVHIIYPIARLVASTKTTATFELDKTVELYTP